MRRRKRQEAPSDMVDSVASALRSLGLTDHARRIQLRALWRAAVGDPVAQRAQPWSFNRGVLVLRTQSAAWQNELTFLKATLIQKVNEAAGHAWVRDIRVVSGPLETFTDAPQPPLSPPEEKDIRDVQRCAQTIEDPELRRSFGNLMLSERRRQRSGRRFQPQ